MPETERDNKIIDLSRYKNESGNQSAAKHSAEGNLALNLNSEKNGAASLNSDPPPTNQVADTRPKAPGQPDRNQNDVSKQQELKAAQAKTLKQKAGQNIKNHNAGKSKAQIKAPADAAKKLAEIATPMGLFALFFQMNLFTDWMYGLALFFAILKDILNFIEISGVGYALVVVATFLCTIFISMMMLLGRMTNGSASQKQGKVILSWLILLFATAVELIPGVNFIPEETLAVIIIYILMLSDRKSATEEKRLAAD